MATRKGSNKRTYLIAGAVFVVAIVLVLGGAWLGGFFDSKQPAAAQSPVSTAPATSQSVTTTAAPTTQSDDPDTQAPQTSVSRPTASFDTSGNKVLDAYGLHITLKTNSNPVWVQFVDNTALTENRVILIKGGCQVETMGQCPGLVVVPKANDPFKDGACASTGVYDNLYYGSPSAPVSMTVGTVPAQYIKLTQCQLDGSPVENPDILHLWRFDNGTVLYDQDPQNRELTKGTDQVLPLLTRSR